MAPETNNISVSMKEYYFFTNYKEERKGETPANTRCCCISRLVVNGFWLINIYKTFLKNTSICHNDEIHFLKN